MFAPGQVGFPEDNGTLNAHYVPAAQPQPQQQPVQQAPTPPPQAQPTYQAPQFQTFQQNAQGQYVLPPQQAPAQPNVSPQMMAAPAQDMRAMPYQFAPPPVQPQQQMQRLQDPGHQWQGPAQNWQPQAPQAPSPFQGPPRFTPPAGQITPQQYLGAFQNWQQQQQGWRNQMNSILQRQGPGLGYGW